jgi:hypothetical protein
MLAIIFIIIFILLGAGLFVYSQLVKAKKNVVKNNPVMTLQEAEGIVNQLTDLGYYKYADLQDIDSLKQDLINSLSQYGVLSTICFDTPIIPKDYRYYYFDGETIFEQGGFDDALTEMQIFFKKIELKLEITNHIEEADTMTDGLNHEITLNGKRYIIFKDFRGYGWGEAAQKFAEMINDQLQIQGKDERLYLINGGNDGSAVFLTNQQFMLIDKALKDDQWKPLKVEQWCKLNKIPQ